MVAGKRFHSQRDNHGEGKNQRRRINGNDEKGNDELIVYRILCPDGVIGSVIGKSGKVINSIRQETRAKVKVVDPFPGAKDRIISIYCYVKEKEEIDVDDELNEREPLCSAQDALLKVHAAIANALATVGDSDKKRIDREECQILVPSSQTANIIGKAGSTIKKLRNKTKTNIKVTAKDASDPSHSCAMEFDNFVTISGEEAGVKKALIAISSIMYKFPPMENISLETTVQEALQTIIIPSDVPIYPPPGGLYRSVDPLISSRSMASILGATRVQDFQDYTETQNTWPLSSSTLPVISGVNGTSHTEELIIRILCPFDKIGRVIGKGGGTIKSIRQTSGARVDVDDSKHDRDDCLIIVTSTESSEDVKSMAVETVLLLQGKINDEDDDIVTMRILVPSKIIGCIIGKSGSIINEIRKKTKADIHISKGEKSKRADSNDELVEVVGETGRVRDALVQIILRLRDDVLRVKEAPHNSFIGSESIYRAGTSHSMSSLLPSIPPITSLGYDQKSETGSGLGLSYLSDLYGYGTLPSGEHDYAGLSSHPSRHYGRVPSPSRIEMLIPSNALGKVMGKGGANIVNIQKISGAMIEISDSKSTWGDRIALISGTNEQRRSAENLIQAFIMSI